MTEFRPYMHIERFGNEEVQGIELGECYIFPKIDGTNGSIWAEFGDICAGSRHRELSLEDDNQGFMAYVVNHKGLTELVQNNPTWNIYGEWLVPHSLKTYRQDAWRRFYIFDIWDNEKGCYLHYNEYQPVLSCYDVDYISPLCVFKNANYDNLLHEIKNNTFLIEEGKGSGEGIVIKNYSFQNRYGRTTWAKLVTNEFKEKHFRMQSTEKLGKQMVEEEICNKYITEHMVNKVYAKIVNEESGWNSKYIPRLLNTVYYDLINEELWNIVKAMKNPTVNFKTLNILVTMKIKALRSELF